MTSANLLSRLRTLLDEASASYWTDTEAYAALADGQRELVSQFVNIYKFSGKGFIPNVIRAITKNVSANITAPATSATLPTDYIQDSPLSVRYSSTSTSVSSRKPCLVRSMDGLYHKQGNAYLQGDATYPFCYIDGTSINFETAPVAGSYDFNYLSMPADIASGQVMTLPDTCSDAIVQFAFAFLMAKDQRVTESQAAYSQFYQLIPKLYA